ncbi:MAG: radical SAM protein [Candidatus Thorarchaeota archaeon]
MESEEYLAYRRDWERLPQDHIVSDFPLHVDIELTNRCNLQCDRCMFHSSDAPFPPETEEDMDFKIFKKVIDEGSKKGLKAIKLNYRGEPLLYPQLKEVISYAKHAGILDVQLNTNAILLSKQKSKELIIAGLDLLIVTDYDFPPQIRNTKFLHDVREIHGKQTPMIRVQTDKPERWNKIADEIVKPIYYDYHNIKEVFEKSEFKCSYPWLRFLVMVNGDIMMCSCGTVYHDKYLGNIKDWELESLWHSRRMKFLRICHEHRCTELVRICRLCPMRNDWIERNK